MLVVFIGPSAIGKTFAANELIKEHPESFEQPKLYTTRLKRINETMSDRITVTKEKFADMVENGEFAVYGNFAGNRYGYTSGALRVTENHILINAWPALTPQFAEIKNCLLIGMQPPDNYESLLIDRMKRRGDNIETINKRIDFIQRDIQDLKSNSKLISNEGKIFTVNNDSSVFTDVLPWIENKLFNA